MAKIKQQKKRILTDKKKNIANHAYKSQIRTAIKKFNFAIIQSEKLSHVFSLANHAIKLLDKSLDKKIHKSNFINRHKSQIHKKMHLFNQKQNLSK